LSIERNSAGYWNIKLLKKIGQQRPPPKKKKKIKRKRLCQLTFVMVCSGHCLHLVMHAFIWLHTDRFRVIRFGASYVNLRQPHVF